MPAAWAGLHRCGKTLCCWTAGVPAMLECCLVSWLSIPYTSFSSFWYRSLFAGCISRFFKKAPFCICTDSNMLFCFRINFRLFFSSLFEVCKFLIPNDRILSTSKILFFCSSCWPIAPTYSPIFCALAPFSPLFAYDWLWSLASSSFCNTGCCCCCFSGSIFIC